jgi:hypothetical protein
MQLKPRAVWVKECGLRELTPWQSARLKAQGISNKGGIQPSHEPAIRWRYSARTVTNSQLMRFGFWVAPRITWDGAANQLGRFVFSRESARES